MAVLLPAVSPRPAHLCLVLIDLCLSPPNTRAAMPLPTIWAMSSFSAKAQQHRILQWFLKLESRSLEVRVTELTQVLSLTPSSGAQEQSPLDVWELALQALPKAKVSLGWCAASLPCYLKEVLVF